MTEDFIRAAALMPKSPGELELLQSRAEKLAENLAPKQAQEKRRYYLQFKLNSGLYGIPQQDLEEVIYPKQLVGLPWLPAFISGVVPWKGLILTVLDTNYLCTQQKISAMAELNRIIVLTHQQKSLGLLVNEVCNFFDYTPSQLKIPLQNPLRFNPDYFLGLADYSVTFLQTSAIFNDPKLKISHPPS
jgi:purine-binding chemotaxis protein CheW